MIAASIAACLVLLVIVLACIPSTAEFGWQDGRFYIQLSNLPLANRKKREERKSPKRQGKKKKRIPPEYIPDLCDLALELFQNTKKKINIQLVRVHFLSAFEDPYETAMIYNCVGMAMEGLTTIAGKYVATLDLHTDLDFDCACPHLEVQIILTMSLGDYLTPLFEMIRGYRAIVKKHRVDQ